MRNVLIPLAVLCAFGALSACKPQESDSANEGVSQSVVDWEAIAAWPGDISVSVEPIANPDAKSTVIVLDDSGSMGADIVPAKVAVIQTLSFMEDGERVAVLGLNYGTILPFMTVADARLLLEQALAPVGSNGGTPLGASIEYAHDALRIEAAATRGYGVFTIIATTDGQASDASRLARVVDYVTLETPVRLRTIGVGIRGKHTLNQPGKAGFVSIGDVDQLGAALGTLAAESVDYSAAVRFEGIGE